MDGHFPVVQILLQIEVRLSIMAFPPAWANFFVCYPIQLTFPQCLLPPPLLAEKCDALHLVSADSQVLLVPHQSYSCQGLSSTLSIC